MLRSILLAVVALLLASSAETAQAQWYSNVWHGWQADYHRVKHWPKPFIYPDRATACAPFDIMVANGWRRQNLMGDHHFTPDSRELTDAGRMKARWILTQAPVQHRTIFVERGADPNATAARIDAVQQTAAQMLPHGELPVVMETHIMIEGKPADEVDRQNVKFYESAPAPQLPAATLGGGGN